MLNQFAKSAAALRRLTPEKGEARQGHARTALGEQDAVPHGGADTGCANLLGGFASRKLYTAQNTDLMVLGSSLAKLDKRHSASQQKRPVLCRAR